MKIVLKSVVIIAIVAVAMIGVMVPSVFAESVSNNVGSITIDESVIEISSNANYSLKIYGMINPSQHDNKGHIQITLPDGTSDGMLFIPTNDGYFESFFDINYESQLGDYKIFGTYGKQIIGSLSFSVSEKQFTVQEIKEARDETSKQDAINESEELAKAEALSAVKEAEALAAEQAESVVKEAEALATAQESNAQSKAQAESAVKEAEALAAEQAESALVQQEKEKSMEPLNTLAKIGLVVFTIIILMVIWKGKKMNDNKADENLLVDIAKD